MENFERQNPGTAINVFGWDKDEVIVHRLSEQEGNIPRINLMITKQGDNTHYSYVKRLTALLYDQNRHNGASISVSAAFTGFQGKNY